MARFVSVLLLLVVASPEAWAQWVPEPWEVRCLDGIEIDPDECSADVGGSAVTIIRHELDSVTAWLRDLGFPQPVIERGTNGRDYLAHMGPDSLFLDGDHVLGLYSPSRKGLLVNAFHFIGLENDTDDTGTVAHELFHAVQAAYPSYETGNGQANWIIEGTAQAFEAAWLTREGPSPLAPGGHAYVYGHRDYARSIFSTTEDQQEYATSHFWLALGEMIGSRERIVYLQDVLENSGSSPGAMLDVMLETHHPDGFSHVFPRLLARHASDPEHYASNRGRRRVTDGFEETVDVTIPPLAGALMRIENAESEMLEIEVESDDHPSLHFVFGGQQASESPLGAGPAYRQTLAPGEHLDVIIANVAPEAAETSEEQVEFTIRARRPDSCDQPPGASFTLTVTGPREGSGSGSFVFDRQTAQVRGRTIVDYTGLSVLDYGDSRVVMWEGTSTLGMADQLALARERLDMPDASDEEVGTAVQNLSMSEMMRLFPEFLEDGEADSPELPDGFSISNATPEGDGSHSLTFKNGGSQVSIMLPFSDHVGTGRVSSPMLNIGIQAPAFLGTTASFQEGIVLAQPELTFSALDPGRCVAGTFSGVYEGPVGQANPVTGSFRVIVPDDALVIDMR